MSTQAVCDICHGKLNVDNINIRYKVKARRHAFDGWSSTYDHNVDICDRCVAMVDKLVNEQVARLCACGYDKECAIHCNHEAGLCPGKAADAIRHTKVPSEHKTSKGASSGPQRDGKN